MNRRFCVAAWFAAIWIPLSLVGSAIAQAPPAQEVIAAPDTLRFSIHLPGNWQFQTKRGDNVYTDYLIFGDSSEMVQSTITRLSGVTPQAAPDGISGWAALFNQSFWRMGGTSIEAQINAFLQSVLVQTELVGQQPVMLGGQYPGVVALVIDRATDTQGYVGAVDVGNQNVLGFIIGVAPSREFADNEALFQGILQSIRMPAEVNAQTIPFTAGGMATLVPVSQGTSPTLPAPGGATPTTAAPPVAPNDAAQVIFYPMDGGVASIHLPANWIVYDRLQQDNLFAYGDTDAAAASRFGTVRADLVPATPVTGAGGLVILYDPAEVGVDPANPDLALLLNPVAERLTGQGYQIVDESTEFTVGGHPGQYILVKGSEYGYIAVILFDEKLAYITATGTEDSFEPNQDLLQQILESLRVPAEAEPESAVPTANPGGGGIGGLTGGGSAPAPATPTPSGIGGLG